MGYLFLIYYLYSNYYVRIRKIKIDLSRWIMLLKSFRYIETTKLYDIKLTYKLITFLTV